MYYILHGHECLHYGIIGDWSEPIQSNNHYKFLYIVCHLGYVIPGAVMIIGGSVVSGGHEGHSGQVMVGHETEGQSGQFCSGHSVEIMSVRCQSGIAAHTLCICIDLCVIMCNQQIWLTADCGQDPD